MGASESLSFLIQALEQGFRPFRINGWLSLHPITPFSRRIVTPKSKYGVVIYWRWSLVVLTKGRVKFSESLVFLTKAPNQYLPALEKQCMALLLPHHPICHAENEPRIWHSECGDSGAMTPGGNDRTQPLISKRMLDAFISFFCLSSIGTKTRFWNSSEAMDGSSPSTTSHPHLLCWECTLNVSFRWYFIIMDMDQCYTLWTRKCLEKLPTSDFLSTEANFEILQKQWMIIITTHHPIY